MSDHDDDDEYDSEEDEDFDPTELTKDTKKRKHEEIQTLGAGGRVGGICLEGEPSTGGGEAVDLAEGEEQAEDGAEEEEEEEVEEEVLTERQAAKVAAKKEKISDLWALMNTTATAGKGSGVLLGRGVTIGSLERLCQTKPSSKKRKHDPNTEWITSLNMLKGARPQGPRQQSSMSVREAAKGAMAAAQQCVTIGKASLMSMGASEQRSTLAETLETKGPLAVSNGPVIGGASSSKGPGTAPIVTVSEKSGGTVVVTESRDFAGQEVKLTRTLDARSKEAQLSQARAAAAASSTGIDAVLLALEKKKKMNVLDKTSVDWEKKKTQEDPDIVEDLEKHKRSKDTYLEKEDFLKRAELREYELERDARLAAGGSRHRV